MWHGRRLDAGARLKFSQACPKFWAVRRAEVALESPRQVRVVALVANCPLEEGPGCAALTANIERVSHQHVLVSPGGECTRAVVVLRDDEDAAGVEVRDCTAIREAGNASYDRSASGAGQGRRVKSIGPSAVEADTRLR